MEKKHLIQLTNDLYRLTLLFPKKEPLRYKMRELADDILANSLPFTNFYELNNIHISEKKTNDCFLQILECVELLDSFFEIAKSQNWVKKEDVLRLQESYNKLKEDLKIKLIQDTITEEKISVEKPQPIIKEVSLPINEEKIALPRAKKEEVKKISSATERQDKILEFLRLKGRAQVWEIKQIFPEVSKRTLRRDFKNLLKQGIIERIGERNATFYQLR